LGVSASALTRRHANDNDTLRAGFLREAKDHSPDRGHNHDPLFIAVGEFPEVEQEAGDEPLA
jgi:hypothetical protein